MCGKTCKQRTKDSLFDGNEWEQAVMGNEQVGMGSENGGRREREWAHEEREWAGLKSEWRVES